MKELQSEHDLGAIESGASLVKLPGLLDLKHKVAAVDVLHDEEEPVLGLKTRVERRQERVVGGQGQNPLLGHGAFHVIVLDDDVLLEDFDGKNLLQRSV